MKEISTKMMAAEEEETKFSTVMGLDVSQAAQIPKDIRKILLERFSKGCRTIFHSGFLKVLKLLKNLTRVPF